MEKQERFEEAVAEYKRAIDHYNKFEAIIRELGAEMCPNFYKRLLEDNYDVHVYSGLTKLAEINEDVIETKDLGEQFTYPYEHYFVRDGLRFFEVSDR